ncbi:MAG: CBS domain-containing protein [Bacillota bacterium]|nr:CBS domain-containing protein [Bacillota bacterium]
MFVRERMTPNPITIQETASITEVTALMKENKLKKVPVLNGTKLVGVVTDKDIDRVSPSGATTLSVFEIGALLAKTTVKDAMKPAITVTPDTYIEDVAIKMREARCNVVIITAEEKVVGIITESDMLDSFIAMLGGREEGNRYIIEADNVPGVLGRLGNATNELGINVNHFVFTHCTQEGNAELLVRTTKDGRIKEVSDTFNNLGFVVKDACVK